MTLLRIWLAATAAVLAILAVWAFAPVLVFMAVLTVALGIVAAGMIDLAHRLPYWIARMRVLACRAAGAMAALVRRLGAGRERQ